MPAADAAAITLRPAQPSDCAALAALSIEVWTGTYLRDGVNETFAAFVLEAFTPGHFAALLRDPAETLIVSQNRVGIDGYIRITEGRPSPVGGRHTEISTLYVQPRHHGRGIGEALLRAGLDHCNTKGLGAPWLTTNSENTPAIGFYHRQGFESLGETLFEIDGVGYPNTVLHYEGDYPSKAD
ncbi:N-acetyltransferase [Phaeobacter sp. PT47_59]|uniref:GNAT family N-acetyltransferase n=1 Tax=Phaeobacter sp. PT47_59 TaxID=3029979 RepID=UPI00238048E2|nr:N-acetyltransferase [Phaeobacter sp. PT47_59]MDE4174710.1 N-acetyltransferase [Phaeobacter sp. PT47_59]